MTEAGAASADPGVPWLTIVTVVKDDPVGLTATALSIAQQELAAVEWVIIDSSGAPINGEDLPAPARLIAQIHWVEPHGVYPAMNHGLAKASGQYVMFVNAGDRFASPEIVRTLASRLRVAQPTWAFGSLILEDPGGTTRPSRAFTYSTEKRRRFRRGAFPWHPAMVASRTSLKIRGGFDESFTIAADYRMMLELAQDSDPLQIPEPITIFRLDGLSMNRWRESLHEAYRARCAVYGLHGWSAALEALLSMPVLMRALLFRLTHGS